MKTRSRVPIAILLLVVAGICLAACSKPKYTCTSYLPQSVQCTLNTDTVYYVTNGFADLNQRVKAYYEALGYTCEEVHTLVAGWATYEHVSTERDVQYLEAQGFVCKEETY